MKVANCILKIAAIVLAVAAAACCIIAFWDRIEAAFYCLKEKISTGKCCCVEGDECVDWEAE